MLYIYIYITQGSLYIHWEKEGGQLPSGRSVDDSHGVLIIRDVKVSDSGIYICQVSDGINIGIKKVTLTVGGMNETREVYIYIYISRYRLILSINCNISHGRSFSKKFVRDTRYS